MHTWPAPVAPTTGGGRLPAACLRWPAVAGVKRPIVRQQAARAGRVEDGVAYSGTRPSA